MEVFKNKHGRRSCRLSNWDYSGDGWYFVTICTKGMVQYFGEIRDFMMELNKIGCVAAKYWQEIPQHFKNVRLDEWVVMPNHIHGIVIIDKPQIVTPFVGTGDGNNEPQIVTPFVGAGDGGMIIDKPHSSFTQRRDAINRVPTKDCTNGGITGHHNPMGTGSLGEIIRWFKGRTSFEIHKSNPNFQWQSRFYDHIIESDRELHEIREYIYYNPQMWDRDRNNPNKL